MFVPLESSSAVIVKISSISLSYLQASSCLASQ